MTDQEIAAALADAEEVVECSVHGKLKSWESCTCSPIGTALSVSALAAEVQRQQAAAAEYLAQADEAYAAMHANRERVRVVEQERDKICARYDAYRAEVQEIYRRFLPIEALDSLPKP